MPLSWHYGDSQLDLACEFEEKMKRGALKGIMANAMKIPD
jgi:hypothetical protein